jgi:D-beta-D-heptose 7-phosphate kinase / D-beta-D-heptose 1-phosphate adenosyltransferase
MGHDDRRDDSTGADPPTVMSVDELVAARERWRRAGRSVVWTNGCFDLLHAGHVLGLEDASALGDVLVVGVNDDASVRRLKGAERPIVPLADRVTVVAALAAVDHVVVLEDDEPTSVLERLRPDVHCKGGDYGAGDTLAEREAVERAGGQVRILPFYDGRSTTAIVADIRARKAPRDG